MRLAKVITVITTSALSVSPAMAAPSAARSVTGHAPIANPSAGQSAAQLSLAKSVRTGEQATSRDKLAGGGGFVVAVLAAAAIIAGIFIVAESNDKTDSN